MSLPDSKTGTWNQPPNSLSVHFSDVGEPIYIDATNVKPGTVYPFAPVSVSLKELLDSTPLPEIEKDPNGVDAHSPGAKLDAGKLQPWLFLSGFANALEEVAKVTTVGAQKYTRNGWKDVDNGQERYMEAAMRHLLAYGQGHEVDATPGGTNCLHLAQVAWNLLAVLELQLRAKGA